MNPTLQADFLTKYFSQEGLGYVLGRVHINSCDFSVGNYDFDNVSNDFNLTHFDTTLQRDMHALIPLIRKAMASVQDTGQRLQLLASPWSPPKWMKTNKKMNRSGRPCLKKGNRYKRVWANYIAMWVTAYKNKGVDIWAITPQNEPEAMSAWESCLLTPSDEADFLGRYLGPRMRSRHPEVKILIFDHNKGDMLPYV